MTDNRYEGHSDRSLVQEYSYFRPMGPHPSARENICRLEDATVEELLEITDELARRVNPAKRTDTRRV